MRGRLAAGVLGVAIGVLAAGLAWTDAAHAQEGGELTDEEARNLFQAGAIAFDQGRFVNALEHFERAYTLSKRPQLLFNIGVVADRLRQDARALQAFEQYMELVPDGAEAANVRARIAVLRKTIEERRSAEPPPEASGEAGAQGAQPGAGPQVAPPPAAPAPAAPPARPAMDPPAQGVAPAASERDAAQDRAGGGSAVVPWVLVGAGAAVAVTGGVLLALGQSRRGKIEDAAVGSAWDEVAQYDDADTFTGVGAALLGVGVAGAVIGVVLLAGGEGDGGERASASVQLGPSGVLVRGAL
jgi:tetratricopeptide (TPR) repeat protein